MSRRRRRIPREILRYKDSRIFQQDAKRKLKPGQIVGPVEVGLEKDLLDKDEVAALCRGPKFCGRRVLDEERFLVECEKSYFKVRIEMNDLEGGEDPGAGN